MPSFSVVDLLGTANPTFSTNVTDLDVVWVDGQPRLVTTALPGPGAGYALYDLSAPAGAAALVALQSYSAVVGHGSRPEIVVLPSVGGTGANLIAAGLEPWGWASYGLGASGFGASLNNPLFIDPSAVAGFSAGGANFVYLAPQGSSVPLGYRLLDNGALIPVSGAAPTTGGPDLDAMAVGRTGSGSYLVTASAAGNVLSTYAIDAGGALALADQVTVDFGIGFSKPTDVATVTIQGLTYGIVASSESSSLSTFRLLPGGLLYEADHVVDDLGTRFSGATALATLETGGQVFVFAGGADDGVEVMALLPDGRLVQILSIADTAATSLADVTSIAVAQVGGRVQLFAASATEPGITQVDLSLGPIGTTLFRAPGVQTGTGANDLLCAGPATTAIYGGAGDDLIVGGGAGVTASLFGGAGRDLFVLSPTSGTILVADYQVGVDRLDLTAFPMLRNIGQLSITSTATGALITYGATTIQIESFDGNPISATAFAQSQMLRLTRYAPTTTTGVELGSNTHDQLTAPNQPTTLIGLLGNDSLTGNIGDDVLDGGEGIDSLQGAAGADRLLGGTGNDLLDGGTGGDSLDGGTGDDRAYGGMGSDSLFGGDGQDVLWGDDDDDVIFGGAGNDTSAGGTGNDAMDGGSGLDQLWAGSGNDTLFGAGENDTLWGEAGSDELHGDTGADVLWGGDGDDVLFGGAQNDSPVGGTGNDMTDGGSGDDQLRSGEGNDTLLGGDGNDTLWGEAGPDSLLGGTGADVLWGGDDNDLLFGGAGNDTLAGEASNDLLDGGGGIDRLSAGTGNDTLLGGDDNDLLWGEAGNDELNGGSGADQFWGGVGSDRLLGGDGDDVAWADLGNDTLWGEDGQDTLYGQPGHDLLYGGGGDDRLWAGDGNDTLDGGNGNDLLRGEQGNNLLYGGAGDDTLLGGLQNDTLSGGDGDDRLSTSNGRNLALGGRGNDTITGGTGNDRLEGNEGTDQLFGGNGNDTLWSGTGRDFLSGGAGADRFVYRDVADMGLRTTSDVLRDFRSGADKLDFTGLGLRFVGKGFSGTAGELSFTRDATGGTLWLDLDGDRLADHSLRLDTTFTLGATDFLL